MAWDYKQSFAEVVRHAAFKAGMDHWLLRRRSRRGFVLDHLNRTALSERFSEAYRLGAWVHSTDQRSRSGRGSEIGATAHLGPALSALLSRLGCRTLLDVGCGDWNWMRAVSLPCDYIGIDIVPEVIEANRQYEREGVQFETVDAIKGPLPNADVALCREVLFHLSFRDGRAVLANIRKAARWLLATSDSLIWFNADIRSGDYRKLNLSRSPYRLANMKECIMDDAVERGRLVGLWSTDDLPR